MPTDRSFSPSPTQPFALLVNKSPAVFFFSYALGDLSRKNKWVRDRLQWGLQPTKNPTGIITVVTKRADSLLKTPNLVWNVYTSVSNEEDLVTTNL